MKFALLNACASENCKKYPSGKLKNLLTEGKKIRAYGTDGRKHQKAVGKTTDMVLQVFSQTYRQLVYDFKDGRSHEAVAQMTAARMIDEHGSRCSQLVFIPVPASSVRKNEIRYMDFCKRVCELTGAINGYDHVRVCGERLAIHENRKAEKEIRKVSVIEFDEEWFKEKDVIVFDDVITRGISFGIYANQLESFGANVIEGIFLARTHYKV